MLQISDRHLEDLKRRDNVLSIMSSSSSEKSADSKVDTTQLLPTLHV
jgi:hypothetical protein